MPDHKFYIRILGDRTVLFPLLMVCRDISVDTLVTDFFYSFCRLACRMKRSLRRRSLTRVLD